MNEVLKTRQPHRAIWLRPTAFILVCAMMVWMLSININFANESQQAFSLYQDKAAINAMLKHDESSGISAPQPSSQTAATAVFSEKMQKLADAYAIARTEIENERYQAALVQIDLCLALDDGANQALSVDLWLKKGALHLGRRIDQRNTRRR